MLKKIYIKCNIWRVAVCPSYIQDARFLKVKGVKARDSVPSRKDGNIVNKIGISFNRPFNKSYKID